MRLPIYILISLLFCGITLAPSFSYAQETYATQRLSETRGYLQSLMELKDDTTIDQEEKDQREIALRIDILEGVLDVSTQQLQDISTQLDSIQFPDSEEWSVVKEYLTQTNQSFLLYYQSVKDSILSASSTEALKEIAKDITKEKTENIDPHVKRVSMVMSALSLDGILSLADDRREKIRQDIEKIYNQKLVSDTTLRSYFTDASSSLLKAHDLNNKAKQIILHIYTESSTSTVQFIESLKETIVEERNAQLKQTAPPYTIYTLEDITINEIETHLRSIIRQTAKHVQNTYEIFLEMSVLVKNHLN